MADPPKRLDQVRQLMRMRHMPIRTESACVQWINDFLHFHKKQAGRWRHPGTMSSQDVNQFLTYLAVDRHVATSTQIQAFSAMLFLFKQILKTEIQLDAVRAKHLAQLPVVLSQDDVKRVLCAIPQGPYRIMAGLMDETGLRLMKA